MGTALARFGPCFVSDWIRSIHRPPQTRESCGRLLGDRSFSGSGGVGDFQKTGVFSRAGVAGLHVLAAVVTFLYLVGESVVDYRGCLATVLLLAALSLIFVGGGAAGAGFLRAGLMTGSLWCWRFFYRRLEILNSAAIAALVLAVAKPSSALIELSFGFFLAIWVHPRVAGAVDGAHVHHMFERCMVWRDVTGTGRFPRGMCSSAGFAGGPHGALDFSRLSARNAKMVGGFWRKGAWMVVARWRDDRAFRGAAVLGGCHAYERGIFHR